ncbi:MAG: hypothetical protein Q8O07_03355 [Chloroflexota bacterium]|nr:hypothetical protein [Chloroflexota bacterium]
MRKATVHPFVLLLVILGLGLVLVLAATACQPLSSAPPPAAPSVTTVPTATPASQPTAEEEDCMASCHIPDANEEFAAGAGPQPASHVARAVCLSCHSTLINLALPADHRGRMDPSCALCHKESAKAG